MLPQSITGARSGAPSTFSITNGSAAYASSAPRVASIASRWTANSRARVAFDRAQRRVRLAGRGSVDRVKPAGAARLEVGERVAAHERERVAGLGA